LGQYNVNNRESHFLSKIRQVREQELLTLKRIGYVNALDTFTWSCTPFLVAFATFAVHTVVRNEPLSPETVFVAISLFNLLQFPLSMLPYMISSVVEAAVSLRRVSNFLLDEDLMNCIYPFLSKSIFAYRPDR
jgi:ABC-type multidrug transport system fused ATPase/permease subunit